jgi:hypothetical protein
MDLLLKPEHFAGAETVKFVDGCLRFDRCAPGGIDRSIVLLETEKDDEHPRRKTRVVLNPASITPRELHRLMSEPADRSTAARAARSGCALDSMESYPAWTISYPGCEGQTLIAVAFNAENAPVGYAAVEVGLFTADDDPLAITLFVTPVMFYVLPAQRGEGYGLDLTCAVAHILRDVLIAAYQGVPDGARIDIHVYADFINEAGDAICNSLVSWLTFNADTVADDAYVAGAGRPGVEIISEVGYEVGY